MNENGTLWKNGKYMHNSLKTDILGAEDSEYKEFCILACDAV
jgi:hypothetical protein